MPNKLKPIGEIIADPPQPNRDRNRETVRDKLEPNAPPLNSSPPKEKR
jgi:hypothetical protein